MKYILRELEVGEVSLVDKAANKRKFLLVKSEKGGNEMPMTEIILSCDESKEDILKSVAEMDDSQVALLKSVMELDESQATLFKSLLEPGDESIEELKKAKMSEKAVAAVKAALKALRGVKEELPEDIMKKLAACGGYAYPEEKAMDGEKDKEKDKMKKEFGGFVIQKNEDGTTDFSNVPEEVRPLVKSLWEKNEESAKKAEDAERIAKAERDARIMKEFVTKAEGLQNLSNDPITLGAILKSASESLTADQYTELQRVLDAAESAVAESKLFK